MIFRRDIFALRGRIHAGFTELDRDRALFAPPFILRRK